MAIRMKFSSLAVRISKSLDNLLNPSNHENVRSTIQRFFNMANSSFIFWDISMESPNKVECCASVSGVSREALNGRVFICCALTDFLAFHGIVDIGDMYLDFQQVTQDIRTDMPFTTLHFFFPRRYPALRCRMSS